MTDHNKHKPYLDYQENSVRRANKLMIANKIFFAVLFIVCLSIAQALVKG